MINRDIIDTDKKTPAENLGQLVKSTCYRLHCCMIAFLALGTCFADDTAKQGINYCWSILAACVTVPALQFVFFTPAVIRQMAYPARWCCSTFASTQPSVHWRLSLLGFP